MQKHKTGFTLNITQKSHQTQQVGAGVPTAHHLPGTSPKTEFSGKDKNLSLNNVIKIRGKKKSDYAPKIAL